MSFKLFTHPSSIEYNPDLSMSEVRDENPKHHNIIFDRGFFNCQKELSAIIDPLKFCLLLAVQLDKQGLAEADLPSIEIFVISSYT